MESEMLEIVTIETKLNAQQELKKLNLKRVINKMNGYAAMRLRLVDVKQLEGMTPEDFVQDVLLRILGGYLKKVNGEMVRIYPWEESKCNDMEAFLMMNIRGDCSNFLKKISRRNQCLLSILEGDSHGDVLLYLNKTGQNMMSFEGKPL